MKYKQNRGETIELEVIPESPEKHRIRCCDCKLVHDLEFDVEPSFNKKGKLKSVVIRITPTRNERATSACRRKK